MAKQHHQYYIGRQGNLLYYQWRGVYCICTKGSLDKKRFDEDPAFAGSRKRAVDFGVASKLAAEVYQHLPGELKKRGVIGKLTGWVHKKLLSGKSREDVKRELLVDHGLKAIVEKQIKPFPACTASNVDRFSKGLSGKPKKGITQTVDQPPPHKGTKAVACTFEQDHCSAPPGG